MNPLLGRHKGYGAGRLALELLQVGGRISQTKQIHAPDIGPHLADTAAQQLAGHLAQAAAVKFP
jgi:hypothetical protein